MSKDHDYGEPWNLGAFRPHPSWLQEWEGDWTPFILDQEQTERAVECVNAMAGLDPAKVRDLIMDLRINDLDEETGSVCPCSSEDCWPCRARACFYEKGEA